MSNFFQELKRRNVFRVAAAYAVVAWIMVQIGEAVFPAFGVPDGLFRGMVILLVMGFPLALVFAWAFEKTPEGIKLEKNVDRTQSITPVTARKLDRTIIALLGLAVIVLLVDRFALNDAGQAVKDQGVAGGTDTSSQSALRHNARSIAVLPFVDMSEAGDSAYFADGLSEELLNLLAKIKELRVAGRTSSFAFKGHNEDLRQIGDQLSVEHILEGSVRRSGNKVRVTAQLVSTKDGYHVWSETYDRELTDIFAIQDDIASHVVRALKIELLGEQVASVSQTGTRVPDAYNAYLLGLHKMNDFSFSALQESRGYFQRATSLDPAYAPGFVGLARVASEMANTGLISQAQFAEMAEPVLARALQLDPVNPEAQAALGALRAAQSRFEEADAAYRRSLELNPSNVHALTSYGSFLTDAGDLDAARGFLDRAVELDPLSNRVLWNAGVPDMFSGREHQVMQFVTRMQAIDSKAPQSVYGEVFMYLTSGRLDLAVPIGRRAMALDPEDFELVAHQAAMHIDLGDLDRAVALVRQALALGPDEPFPLAVQAALTLRQGDLSGAATIARRAADMGLENRHGSEWIFLSILRMDAARSGDYAGYLEQIRALVQPQLLESPPRPFWWWDVFSAVHMSYAYRQLERQQEREQLDQALRAKLYGVSEGLREHQMPWVEAAMLAMDGQGDMAMEVLERATGSGFRFWWMLKDDPIFAPIASTARFKAILGGFEERYGAQFRNLQASEATPGDGKKTQ